MAKSQKSTPPQTSDAPKPPAAATIETDATEVEPPVERDEFCDPQYIDPNAKLPRLQALRGTSANNCGYFVAVDQMARAGWHNLEDLDASRLVAYTYESTGNEELGLLLPQPRMLVCPRTPVLAQDRAASQEAKQPVILGRYLAEHKEDPNIANTQYFEVFLVGEDHRPLHQVPLSYKASGANQASFSSEWNKLVDETTNCHAIANGIPARPKDRRFKSLCVFACQTRRELVGDKQKSFACRVVSHEVPTLENWRDYFLGFDEPMRRLVWDGLQPVLPVALPEAIPRAALPSEDSGR